MRIFAQDRAFYRGVRVDLGGRPEADRRFELLRRVERAHGHGLTLAASLALLAYAGGSGWPWRQGEAPVSASSRLDAGCRSNGVDAA